MQSGKLITNGVHLQTHEFHTVKILQQNGYDIELIPPSQISGVHLPDIMLNNIPWEIKAPAGNGKNTISHNINNALCQSENIIIDLIRCKIADEKAINEIIRLFNLSKRTKKLIIIPKNKIIIDISK